MRNQAIKYGKLIAIFAWVWKTSSTADLPDEFHVMAKFLRVDLCEPWPKMERTVAGNVDWKFITNRNHDTFVLSTFV